MSNDDLFNIDKNETDPEAGEQFEADPSTIAFLDQEAAAFAEISQQFADTYGFVHDCHCDTDYSSGKIVEVTECFAGMVVEALETCGRLNTENKALKEMLTVMFRLNDELVEANSAVPGDTEPEVADVEIPAPPVAFEEGTDTGTDLNDAPASA